MSLQYKVLTLILAAFVAYSGIAYTVQRLVILPSFLELEQQEAMQDMERATQAIEREITALAQPANDWSSWDDSYRFLVDHNPQFITDNLSLASMRDLLKVDLLRFSDVSGNVVWNRVLDAQAGTPIELQELSESPLPPDHPLVAFSDVHTETRGVLMTERGPMLVVSKPSLDNHSQGPAHGAVTLGRFLDAASIARIAEQARVDLAVRVLSSEAPGTEPATVARELASPGVIAIREGADENRLYRLLPDIFSRPALLLQVNVPRRISAQGASAARFALLSLLCAGLITMLVLLSGIRHLVLAPVDRLIRHVDDIGQRGDLSARLNMNRNDQLGVLAREFDQMVSRLAQARGALLEQSHQAGVAEMASGVLHNIGNAITPLKVGISKLESTLRGAPAAEMDLALTELAHDGTANERRQDLVRFVELAGRELAGLVTGSVSSVGTIARQVEHVQKILADQERASRAARVLEPVPLAELVRESIELLGDELRREIRIELDASLLAAGQVVGSRVALQQILVNLLKNSAESIRERAVAHGDGRIVLRAAADRREERAMVRLCVTDNGGGFAREIQPRLFQRGFSTKMRSTSGQGLHWCAVTAAALGGHIQIESPGAGQGATVTLWLPQSEQMPS